MKKNECEACSWTGQVLDGERCGFCDHEKPPVLFGDVCRADADELRDIAEYFEKRGKPMQGEFLRKVADRHEVLAGAYSSAIRVSYRNIEK